MNTNTKHLLIKKLTVITTLMVAFLLTSCSSIEPMGSIGKNKVYSISNNNFLSSSQMLVVLNKHGDIAAYSGGTTSGYGALGLQTGASVLTAGAIVYAGRSIEHGLQTARVGGIPSKFSVQSNHNININH